MVDEHKLAGCKELFKTRKSPNILLIIVDALRARNLSCYGYSKPTSPNIDSLASEGVLFEDAYSCINATDASLTTIFSGKYPLSHGVLSQGAYRQLVPKEEIRKLNESGTLFLPEILKSKDYATGAIDWIGRWHKRGYDYYSGIICDATPQKLTSPPSHVPVGRARVRALRRLFERTRSLQPARERAYAKKRTSIDEAYLVTAQAKSFIKKNCNKRFFLFLHYWDVHKPYAAPLYYYKNVDNQGVKAILWRITSVKWIRKQWQFEENLIRYDASIAYVDYEIGRLIEYLETCGILDQTLVIFTSDHGESLTEHGIYFEHHGLYDVSIHVPLIFRYPGLPRNKRIKGFIQHFDVVPTILDLLDIDMKNKGFDGKSATPLIHGETNQLHSAVYAEEAHTERKRCIRTKDYKYIHALSPKEAICRLCKRVHGGLEELYDLKADSGETQNILKERPDVAKNLKERLNEWISSLSSKG